MEKASETAIDEYLSREDVTGVMVGLKFKDGKWTDEPCISIRVKDKKPFAELNKEDVIPKTILGTKTDVIEANKRRPTVQGLEYHGL